jgi:DNA repair protein RadB
MKLSVCDPIDSLLGGGLEPGCVTCFYGPSASGKTNIAKAASISCIRAGKKVVYIDTEGGFSIERLEQMSGDARSFASRIILLEPKDWGSQREAIAGLDRICGLEPVGLIVVDSIVALWRITISEGNAFEINRELATQLYMLSRIARERKIPVLITDQVYSEPETGKVEMSSKNIIKWWGKNIVELKHAGKTGFRIARIIKARSLPEDREIGFMITNEGLKESS